MQPKVKHGVRPTPLYDSSFADPATRPVFTLTMCGRWQSGHATLSYESRLCTSDSLQPHVFEGLHRLSRCPFPPYGSTLPMGQSSGGVLLMQKPQRLQAISRADAAIYDKSLGSVSRVTERFAPACHPSNRDWRRFGVPKIHLAPIGGRCQIIPTRWRPLISYVCRHKMKPKEQTKEEMILDFTVSDEALEGAAADTIFSLGNCTDSRTCQSPN